MTTVASQLSEKQRLGRTFYVSALSLIAAWMILSATEAMATEPDNIAGNIVGLIVSLLVLLAAFRGGFISMLMIKGCLGVFGVFVCIAGIVAGVLAIFLGISEFTFTWNDYPLSFASWAALAYIYWALFLSRSVKEFVSLQRELAHARSMQNHQPHSPRLKREG
jgi:uncharacterized phage infection (PIP) family protein YhgE